MKKKNSLKCTVIITCIISFAVFVCTPFLINCIVSIPNKNAVGDPNTTEATWIGFLGDYVGGLLSTLVGAGITGLVAYYLIGKEVSEGITQQTLNTFALDFNADFQKVKNGIVASTTNIHKVLQFYHATFSNDETFYQEYKAVLVELYDLNNALVQLINKHVLMLSYIKDQELSFDPNLASNSFAMMFSKLNDMIINFANKDADGYDIISDYNAKSIPMINDYRDKLLKNEKIII